MNYINEVLGNHFFIKLFLIPSILGGIYISKNIIYKNQLNVNKYVAYLLYSSNFALWIFILKMLYIEINQVSEYGYLLSDVSLLFIAIAVDYFIVSSYQFIEFTVIPLLLGFCLFYAFSYGLNIKSIIFIGISLITFWLTLYVISKYKASLMDSMFNIALISFSIWFSDIMLSISKFPFNLIYSIGVFFKTFMILLFSKFLFSIISSIVEDYSKFKKYTYIDALTNVYNRRKFEEVMEEITKSDRVKKYSLVIFDVDHFKEINDTFGHNSGDYVLREICYLVEKFLREVEENGQLFRYGGDEFFLIFRNRSGSEIKKVMDQIVRKTSVARFNKDSYEINVTISAGISEIREGMNMEQAISYVDNNLYIAKSKGKNGSYYDKKNRDTEQIGSVKI